MSIQKYLDQKRGGEAPAGDIKNNDALRAAAAAGRAALKRVGTAVAEGEKQQLMKATKKVLMICYCGDSSCRVGPFTLAVSS